MTEPLVQASLEGFNTISSLSSFSLSISNSPRSAATDGYSNTSFDSADPDAAIKIPMHDVPAFSPRKKLRIITIGAGYSGMILAQKLQHTYGKEFSALAEHTIFESKSEAGGTWIANSYPGVQCDVPSHTYVFPFAPNPEWSHFYSTRHEIREYIQKTVKDWNLLTDVQFDTTIEGASWEEESLNDA